MTEQKVDSGSQGMSDSKYQRVEMDGQQQKSLVGDKEAPPQRSLCGCFKWFKESPWQRKEFAYWLIFAACTVLLIIVYYSMATVAGVAIAGVFVILVSLYGYNHFRILLGLKEQVDKYEQLNNDFKFENMELSGEVDKLAKAKDQLQETENDLKESNERISENLTKFRELDKNLRASGSSNLEGMTSVLEKSTQMMSSWKKNLVLNEKKYLNELFDRFEMKDETEDMTEEEFNLFLNELPQKYLKRKQLFKNNFKEAAGEDEKISIEEFGRLLDKFVEDGVEAKLEEHSKRNVLSESKTEE